MNWDQILCIYWLILAFLSPHLKFLWSIAVTSPHRMDAPDRCNGQRNGWADKETRLFIWLAVCPSLRWSLTLCDIVQVVSSAIVDKYIGESARLIREMFSYARDHQPCIIFMDEIDAIGCYYISIIIIVLFLYVSYCYLLSGSVASVRLFDLWLGHCVSEVMTLWHFINECIIQSIDHCFLEWPRYLKHC